MMSVTRLVMPALAALLCGACSILPQALQASQGNLYDMRRDAQLAYAAEEDNRAEKLLQGLARAAPNEPENWFYLGNLYARNNRPEEAVVAYQKALMLNSTDARVWHNLGVVRTREAWAAFIQAHNLAKDDPLRIKLEALIDTMEKLPLDGLKREVRVSQTTEGLASSPAVKSASAAPNADMPAVSAEAIK